MAEEDRHCEEKLSAMAGWASRHVGQKRGGSNGGAGGLNPRLAQQQIGLELLRRRAEVVAQQRVGTGEQYVRADNSWLLHGGNPQWMIPGRHGGWVQQPLHQAGQGMQAQPPPLPNWMLSRGADGMETHLQGFGEGTGGELDGYGMLQTQQVEIDGQLHTMFCVPSDSPPRTNYGVLDIAGHRVADRGILGGGPVHADAHFRWPPMSPRRIPPSRSRSPPRHLRSRARSPPAPRSPRHLGLLHARNHHGVPPEPLSHHHLLSRPFMAQLSPRREAMMLGQHMHVRSRGNPDFGRSRHRYADGGVERDRPRTRDRSRERNREKHNPKATHRLPLEQEIAAKRSKLAKHDDLLLFQEREKSEEFLEKVKRSQAHYARVLKEDTIRRKKYEDAKSGNTRKLECLACGSKGFSDLTTLVTHAIQSTQVRKRADHQGFHRALCEMLGWNSLAIPENKRSVSKSDSRRKHGQDTMIVWPATVIVENTRTQKTREGRWVGMTNKDMTTFLKELGHHQGTPRPVWSREGHKGYMLVEFPPTLQGLREAQRLHKHFDANARGRKEWERVQPFWESHLEDPNTASVPEFVRVDETSEEKTNVFYGYLALQCDLHRFEATKTQTKWRCVSIRDIAASSTTPADNLNTPWLPS